MQLEISNPSEYRAALYIRLSKEDENEGPSIVRVWVSGAYSYMSLFPHLPFSEYIFARDKGLLFLLIVIPLKSVRVPEKNIDESFELL